MIRWLKLVLARRRMRKLLRRMTERYAELERQRAEQAPRMVAMEMAEPDEVYRRPAA